LSQLATEAVRIAKAAPVIKRGRKSWSLTKIVFLSLPLLHIQLDTYI
jgi:hypothetical protein